MYTWYQISSIFRNLYICKKVAVDNWFEPILPALGMIKFKAELDILADL